MCGLEGHGAFQSYPGGKLKGELKCTKHRNFLSQLGMIRLQHGIDEEGLKVLFKLPGYAIPEKPAAVAGKKPTTAGAKPAAANAKAGTDAATATTTTAAAGSAAATTDATAPVTNGATETVGAAVSPAHAAIGSTAASTAASTVAASSTVTGAENPAAALTAAISAEVSKAAHKPGKTAGNARANGGGKAGAHAATASFPPAAAAPATKVAASATVTPPPAVNAAPPPVTSPSAPAASHAVQGGLNGNNWQLNLDGGNGAQGLGGFGSSILGGGECFVILVLLCCGSMFSSYGVDFCTLFFYLRWQSGHSMVLCDCVATAELLIVRLTHRCWPKLRLAPQRHLPSGGQRPAPVGQPHRCRLYGRC
jgi:hypothetical protein